MKSGELHSVFSDRTLSGERLGDAMAIALIGRSLVAFYGDVLDEPLPEDLRTILARIGERSQAAGRSNPGA
jgi:hypothetical protein